MKLNEKLEGKVKEGASIRRRCKELFDPIYRAKLERRAEEIVTI